jgi:hypothetical protein
MKMRYYANDTSVHKFITSNFIIFASTDTFLVVSHDPMAESFLWALFENSVCITSSEPSSESHHWVGIESFMKPRFTSYLQTESNAKILV